MLESGSIWRDSRCTQVRYAEKLPKTGPSELSDRQFNGVRRYKGGARRGGAAGRKGETRVGSGLQ